MKNFVLLSASVIFWTGFASLLHAQAPAGAILHLDAGVGVTLDGSGYVTDWEDLAGGDNNAHATVGSSTMPVITHNFPAGILPMVQFNGSGAFTIDNEDDLNLNEFSIFLVEGDHVSPNGWMMCNFAQGSGWNGWGIAEEGPGHWYFFTNNEPYHNVWSDMPPGLDGSGTVPAYYTTTFIFKGLQPNPGDCLKEIYVDNDLYNERIGNWSGVPQGCTYNDGSSFELGGNGGALWNGQIAELLIYPSADPALQASVEAYLHEKYWTFHFKCGDWGYLKADFDKNCVVDLVDFSYFVADWLGCTEPAVGGCDNLIDP